MAQESILIDIKVDTNKVQEQLSSTIQAIADLKKENAELTKEIQAGNDVNGQYAKQLALNNGELERNNRILKSHTALLQASYITEVSENETLDEQRQKLNTLQKAYGSLTKEQKLNSDTGKNLAKQIKDVSDSVKKQEMAIGDARRNVGNYTESIADAIKQTGMMSNASKALVSGLSTIKTVMTAIRTHPLIAIISLLLVTFEKIKSSIQGNAENMAKFRVAMSAFQPVANAVNDIIAKLGEGLATMVGWLGKAITFLSNTQKQYKETLQIANLENKLVQDKINLTKQEAELTAEITKQMRIARDVSKPNEERLKAVEKVTNAEKELARLKKQFAQDEYDLIAKQNNQNKQTSEEQKQQEADAFARWKTAEVEYLNTMIRVDKIRNSLIKEFNDTVAEQEKVAQQFFENDKKRQSERAEQQKKLLDDIRKLNIQILQEEQNEEDAYIEKSLEIMKKYHIIKTNQMMEELHTFQAVEKEYLDTEEQIQKARFSITDKYSKEIMQKMSDDDAKTYETKYNNLVESLKKGEIAEQEFISQFTQLYNTALDDIQNNTSDIIQQTTKKIIEETKSYMDKALNATQKVNQIIANTEKEELNDYKKRNKDKQNALEERLANGIISQEEYNQQTQALQNEMDEKQYETELAQAKREKAFAIMETIINTALGIVKAVAENPMLGGLPGSAIMAAAGALQLATIVAEPLPTKGYATGGIVPGTAYAGDTIPARVNSGEMILNKTQQTELFNIANGYSQNQNYLAMRDAMIVAMQHAPQPILNYKEFTRFQQKVATFKNL